MWHPESLQTCRNCLGTFLQSFSLYPNTEGYIWDSDTAISAIVPRPSRPHWGHPVCVREKAHSEAWASSIWHKRWVSRTDYIQLVSVSLHHDVKLLAWFGQKIRHLRHFFQTCVPHSATSFSSCFHVSHRDHMKSSTSNSWRGRTVTSTSLQQMMGNLTFSHPWRVGISWCLTLNITSWSIAVWWTIPRFASDARIVADFAYICITQCCTQIARCDNPGSNY